MFSVESLIRGITVFIEEMDRYNFFFVFRGPLKKLFPAKTKIFSFKISFKKGLTLVTLTRLRLSVMIHKII